MLFSQELQEDKIDDLKTVLQSTLTDITSTKKLVTSVLKLDLDLNYFIDLLHITQKTFSPRT